MATTTSKTILYDPLYSRYDPARDPLSRRRNYPLPESEPTQPMKSYVIPKGAPGALYVPPEVDTQDDNVGTTTPELGPNILNVREGTTSRTDTGTTTSTSPQITRRITSTRTIGPRSAIPTLDLPVPEYPEYDEREIKKLTQAEAAPGLRAARRELRSALLMAQNKYDNPAAVARAQSEALQGYGGGIENVMSGARNRAASEYQRRRAEEIAEIESKQRAAETEAMANFEADLQRWMKEFETVSTQDLEYGEGTSTTTTNQTSTIDEDTVDARIEEEHENYEDYRKGNSSGGGNIRLVL